MAEVLVQIDGILWDDADKSGKKVTLIGKLFRPDLSIGGGPIMPPSQPPGYPTHPIPPTAEHPIVIPPIEPPEVGQPPVGGTPVFPIWGPPGIELPPGAGYPPVAGHPLPPGGPPAPIKNWEAQVVWTPENGWSVVLVPVGDQNIPTPSGR